MLPKKLIEPLKTQVEKVRAIHTKDVDVRLIHIRKEKA
jgi:hypothetical protein